MKNLNLSPESDVINKQPFAYHKSASTVVIEGLGLTTDPSEVL
jgi:hypothetical protein